MTDAEYAAMTPEQKAFVNRRALSLVVRCTCLCARGCGVPDARIKLMLLALRSPEIAILSDAEAARLIFYLKLNGA